MNINMNFETLRITKESLPKDFENIITNATDNLVTIRSSLKSISDINSWVEDFGRLTNTKWNTRDSCPSGQRFLCRKTFVCHHSSYRKVYCEDKKTELSKNSSCGAQITVKVKLNTPYTRKYDEYIRKGLYGVINITLDHKHRLNTAETLRFLLPSDCKEAFLEYFSDGMGVGESSKYHQEKLEMSENFQESDLANSRINPTLRTIRYWYDQWRLLHLGPRSGPDMISKLKEKIAVYGESSISVTFEENPFAVCIITPLMKRANESLSSSNLIFVDSTSSCDAENHSITFFLTLCAAGAIPIGIVITKGQTEQAYISGFTLLKHLLKNPLNRYEEGTIFMTDNSSSLINAIQCLWPGSTNLLCTFHMGQAVWRWLWDSKHGIPKDHRPILMKFFQKILYSTNAIHALEEYYNALGYVGVFLPTYEKWGVYLENLWSYKEMWCHAFRNERIRGHHTNNFSEVSVRIFKDNVLSRVKAYNVITVLGFCATVLESYYCKRLQEFANGRNSVARLFVSAVKKKASYIKKEEINKLDENYFLVPSENKAVVHEVNIKSGCCSCREGMFGKLCTHQYAIYNYFGIASESFPALTPSDKHEIAYLALGDKAPPVFFYQPFHFQDPVESLHKMELEIPTSHSIDNAIVGSKPFEVDSDDQKNQIFKEILESLKQHNENFGSSLTSLEKLKKRVKSIRSEGQWETFLNTAGSRIPLRHRTGSAIHVQPTSISRRSAQVTKGSKRLPSGRPAKGTSKVTKRKHSLSVNVNLNQPNAKLHGFNH